MATGEVKERGLLVTTDLVGGLAAQAQITPAQFVAIARENLFADPSDATDARVCVMLAFCQRFGFSPIGNQVAAFVKGGKVHPLVMKDAWAVHANRQPDYVGFNYIETRKDGKPDGELIALQYVLLRKDREPQPMPPMRMSEWRRNTDVWKNQPEWMLHVKAFNHMVRLGYGLDAYDELDVANMQDNRVQVKEIGQTMEVENAEISIGDAEDYDEHNDGKRQEESSESLSPNDLPSDSQMDGSSEPQGDESAQIPPASPIQGDDSEPPVDREKSIDQALHYILVMVPEGADQRWAKRREEGRNDFALKSAISKEFGTGDCTHKLVGANDEDCVVRGGRGGPRFWFDMAEIKGKATLEGDALLNRVRAILSIPDEIKKEAAPKEAPKQEKPAENVGEGEEGKALSEVEKMGLKIIKNILDKNMLGTTEPKFTPVYDKLKHIKTMLEINTMIEDGDVYDLFIEVRNQLSGLDLIWATVYDSAIKYVSEEFLEAMQDRMSQ